MMIPFILFAAFVVLVFVLGMRRQREAFESWAQHANTARRNDSTSTTDSSSNESLFKSSHDEALVQHQIDHHGLSTHEQHLVRYHGMDPHTAQLHGAGDIGGSSIHGTTTSTDIGGASFGSSGIGGSNNDP